MQIEWKPSGTPGVDLAAIGERVFRRIARGSKCVFVFAGREFSTMAAAVAASNRKAA